jgi:hypothetical protein
MWATSHYSGLLYAIFETRDRVHSFEKEDIALLSAFCNDVVTNPA